MANQSVRLWEAVLQGLDDTARCCSPSACGDLAQLLRTVADMPAQPKATWKRLVLNMQVCVCWWRQHMASTSKPQQPWCRKHA
jgi:hypothetical protein